MAPRPDLTGPPCRAPRCGARTSPAAGGWCSSHVPRCDTCRVEFPTRLGHLEPIGRGDYCARCAPTVWQGLARMADARQAAGATLTADDRHALALYPPQPQETP